MKENSIEEDIKIINNFITYFNKNIQNGNKADLTVLGEEINALEHILSDYKRVLKENEELKADNYELNNRITDSLENIPVQKVKDKIEEIQEEGYWLFTTDRDSDKCVEVLQELIEEREEKE